MKVIAKTHFLGTEGMWKEGDSKEVSELRADELLKAELVEKAEGETEAAQAADVSSEPEHRETKPAKKKLEKK